MSLEDDIREIEDEIRKTSYNKATSHHIGKLKAKMSRLRDDIEKRASSKGGGEGYSVKKSGDATVVLVGFPSVGKSTLLNKLTDANSEVGAYEFTTLDIIPGALEHKGAKMQILDVPGLVKGAAVGRGRGKSVISVIRTADLVVFLLGVFQTHHYDVLRNELYDAGIRVDTRPPDVTIRRTDRGGVIVSRTLATEIDDDLITAILGEYKIRNAHVLIRENIDLDQLIDVILGNRKYIQSMTVVNKIDLANADVLEDVKEKFPDALLISADTDINIEELKDTLYHNLGFIHIFLKPRGEDADMEEPMIVRVNSTVGDICDDLHRDFRRKFRYAQVWGDSAKHAGQRVGLHHGLLDEDILSIYLEK